MQAQIVAPRDFKCNDKFLLQSTIVPKGTEEKDITSVTFAKEDGKHIDEKKLNVILISPPHSPVLSPMNGIFKMVQYNSAAEREDDLLQRKCTNTKVDGDTDVSRRESEIAEETGNAESTSRKHMEEPSLTKDIQVMKSKLKELESLLREDKLKSKQSAQIRFPLLFVFVVALASLYLGYILNRS